MFFGKFSSSMGKVGVDFGASGVRMLQVREVNSSGACELVGAAFIESPRPHQPLENQPSAPSSGDASVDSPSASSEIAHTSLTRDYSERIRASFAAGGFTGRNCIVSLGRDDVRIQSIRLPKMPDDELKQTAGWEAAQRFGLERDAIEVDYIRTGATLSGADNREEIILIASPRAVIDARLEPLLAAGLRPVAVEPPFVGLVRTFSRQYRREADIAVARVVVEVGRAGSVVLILRGDQIAFCKPLSISGGLFDRAVAEHLQTSEFQAAELRRARITNAVHRIAPSAIEGESMNAAGGPRTDGEADRAVFAAVRPIMNELAKEITLCLRYYGVTFRGQPPQRLILSGGDSLEPRLDEIIARNCNLRVSYDDAPSALSGLIVQIQERTRCSAGPAAAWAAAMGASLRGLGPRRVEKRSAHSTAEVKRAA